MAAKGAREPITLECTECKRRTYMTEKNKKHFFKDFKAELKRVIWPTPKQLANNTVAVIVVVLIIAAIVFVLDLAFENINSHGIDKIKQIVDSQNVETETNTETDSSNTTNIEVVTNSEEIEVQTNSEVDNTNTVTNNTEN